MKRKALFTITALFLLVSCNAGEGSSSEANSVDELSSAEESSFSSIQSPVDSSEQKYTDEELDNIFLVLEDDLRPFVKSDKNGFKVEPYGEEPILKVRFKTDSDISSNGSSSSQESESGSATELDVKEYDIELSCDKATVETFNRTQNRGYCNRVTFDRADVSITKEGKSLISLNQTYVGYLAQTAISQTNPTEYENGIYVDFSKAALSRTIFAPLFNKLILPKKNYIAADSLYDGIQGFFPMSTTMGALLPNALDVLKSEVSSGYLSISAYENEQIESYKIHRELENKEELREKIDAVFDKAFEDSEFDLDRAKVDEFLDGVFEKILAVSGNFEICFNENELENIILDVDLQLDDFTPDNMDELTHYFTLNDLCISGKLTLMDPSDVDYSTYPTDLQNRDVWVELKR